ncbi:MAG TPA: hypothetical protein VEW93_11015 [Acidimicrobiales bacterium]|nr:hypothetical protein [Acidimicrobiales bacterium]
MSPPRTYTYTRTEALLDQVDIFLTLAGIDEGLRKTVIDAVGARWLDEVGIYVAKNGKRVLEGSVEISWSLHSDHADLTVSSDLPGWEGGAAPELRIIAKRLAAFAAESGLPVSVWVRFTPAIRNNEALYQQRRVQMGFTADAPAWRVAPQVQRIVLQDMTEAHASLRDAR